jgi:hypothetical protein
MATRDFARCIAALNHAAGRELSPEEIQSAFDRIHKTALDLKAGRVKPGDGNLSTPEGIMQHAAKLEAQKMIVDVELKAKRAEMDAQTVQRLQAEVSAIKAGGVSDVEAVRRLLVNRPDGRADAFSLETRYIGIKRYMQSRLQDTWAALGDGFMDYLQRPEKARLLVREMKGEDTGDAIAKKGAQAWKKATEDARQWFNDKGGQVGKLEDWGLPQHHSQDLVARAAGSGDRVANQKAWVDFVLPMVDRNRYIDLAGRQLDEPALREFLGHAWETIATGGVNKIEPGQFKGKGARSNRHADERSIHFKDAGALLTYWERFGDRTLPDILMGHVDSMAKDIAFVEHFGSNPNATYTMLRDQARVAATTADPAKTGQVSKEIATLDRLYEYAAGITKPVADQRIANAFSVVHALNTAGRLGSAFWASLIGDKVMFEAVGRVNNLPVFQSWYNELRLLNPANAAERRVLRRQALMLDYMSQSMQRFGDEMGKSSLANKLANTVMKISGMSAVNEWRRGAWALTAMDAIGHEVSTKNFDQIGPQDMRLLQSYGITEADWKVWKLAKLEDLGHGNDTALTPEAIMRIPDADLAGAGDPASVRREAMVKFLGALTAESHNAVIEPGWRERATMYGGLQRGDLRDEITRSFWQFKGFPLTQFHKILDIGMSRPTTGGKVAFLSSMPVALTLAGAMMIQVQEMLGGKDPRPMNDWRFWGAAFLKGGTLGIYGDFLFSNQGTTRYGTGPLEAVAGPTIGAAADIATILAKAPGQVKEGKEPRIAAQVLQTMKGFIPFQNLWYTKAATDHLIFQNAQEALNPGYLESMRRRTEREYGQDWWWRPGQTTPERRPDLSNAIGR